MSFAVEVKERPILFSGPMVRAIIEGRKTQTRRIVKPQPPEWGANGGKLLRVAPTTLPCSGDVWDAQYDLDNPVAIRCPYGKPGDRLWVREAFYITNVRSREYGAGFKADHPTGNLAKGDGGYSFRSFSDDPDQAGEQWNWANLHCGVDRWMPGIHMPRWASRITLEITEVRAERLQEITEADAKAEGVKSEPVTQEDIDNLQISDAPPDVKELARLIGPRQFPARFEFEMLWNSINGKSHPWDSNPFVWVVSFRRLEPTK